MSMLADLVEVVMGVDTHSQTHTAAVLDARTGGMLARATVPADPDGYAELVALAEEHSGLRAWAVEGTGGYGAGLARHWPTPESWSWNWTGPSARHGGRERRPTRSTLNAPPATPWPAPGWPSPRPAPSGPHCSSA